MASRAYFPDDIAALISPAIDAGWAGTVSLRRQATLIKGVSALAAGSTISVAATGVSYIDRQYILGPIQAQTITGTVKGQLLAREFAASDNVTRSNIGIRVVSSDGSTVRGTLLAIGVAGGTTAELSDTGFRNRKIAIAASLSSVDALAGDYIVIELGFRSPTAGTTPEAAFKYGENASDLPEDETQTTDGAGWLEFSQTINLSSLTVTPAFVAAKCAVVAPTSIMGAVTTTPAFVAAKCAVVAPSIVLGAVTKTPAFAAARCAVVAPTSIMGAVTKTPAFVAARCAVTSPSLPVTVTPAFAAARAGVAGPTVLLGAVTVAPPFSAARVGVAGPTVLVPLAGHSFPVSALDRATFRLTLVRDVKVDVEGRVGIAFPLPVL